MALPPLRVVLTEGTIITVEDVYDLKSDGTDYLSLYAIDGHRFGSFHLENVAGWWFDQDED